MKKVLAFVLALVFVLSLAACGESGGKTDSKTPYADELSQKAESGESGLYVEAYTMYSWLTRNLDSFKDPASVELGDTAYYCKDDSGDYKFFLIQIRANNSFGGKSSGYCKVTLTRIEETDWQPPQTYPKYENETVYKSGTTLVKDAFNEYKENNYG
ncbi:MAG: hypothetical protein IJG87_08770 [Ruminococcus sp.]|nr:hypothetical protein [Ruminococcus sp.]